MATEAAVTPAGPTGLAARRGKSTDRSTLFVLSSASVWASATEGLALFAVSAAEVFLSVLDLSTAANGDSVPLSRSVLPLSPARLAASLCPSELALPVPPAGGGGVAMIINSDMGAPSQLGVSSGR